MRRWLKFVTNWLKSEQRRTRRLRRLRARLSRLEPEWNQLQTFLMDEDTPCDDQWYASQRIYRELNERRKVLLKEILTMETCQAKVVSDGSTMTRAQLSCDEENYGNHQ